MQTSYIQQDKIINWLRANLDKERFEHSIGTSETAVELAELFKLDKEKACIAGLIHDCAKCLPPEELKRILNEEKTACSDIGSNKTLHAPAGAILAKKIFGITDDEILSAIRWHTVGKLGMSNFDKIIFIADKIEAKTRPQEYINYIKPYLYQDNGLDRAMLQSFKATIKSLVDRELVICNSSIEIYNELIKKYEKN